MHFIPHEIEERQSPALQKIVKYTKYSGNANFKERKRSPRKSPPEKVKLKIQT